MRRVFASILLLLIGVVPAAAQTTYTLAPSGYQTMLDSNADPVVDGCVWTYTAGTSTPVTTYRTSSGTANSNPVEADSAGRFVIYLAPGSTYKFVYESDCDPPTHGATIRTVDNISAVALGSVQANDIGPCEGRITLTSGTPITTADVTAATTIYFAPYKGNVCPIYDPVGGSWSLLSFSELSLSLGTDAASLPYDLFAYSNAGVMTIERLAWTSDTARATALTTQNGVSVKSGQTSRRYLGTYRTTTVIGQTEDSAAKRYVWNYYNRVPRSLEVIEATASWTYTVATFRQARATATNQVDMVIGLAESVVDLSLIVGVANDTGGLTVGASIGLDSTSTPTSHLIEVDQTLSVAAARATLTVRYMGMPAIGRHVYVWLEASGAVGVTTWTGTGGGLNGHSGLMGSISQ